MTYDEDGFGNIFVDTDDQQDELLLEEGFTRKLVERAGELFVLTEEGGKKASF